MPGGVSRWTGKKDLSWQPLRPEWVIEVGYDAMEGDRFRHTAQFKRSRPDRTPGSCTYDQLDRPVRFNVDEVLAGGPEGRTLGRRPGNPPGSGEEQAVRRRTVSVAVA